MEIKYLVFFTVLICGVPIGYFMSLRFPVIEKVVFFLFIFFTCEMVDINFVSMETYRGTSKGFEFGLVDMAMYILLLLCIKRADQYPIKLFPPGAWLYLIYLSCSIISIMHSDVYIYSGFEVVKMIRMYLYFWIAFNYIRTPEQLETLMISVAAIIFYIFQSVVKQKYLFGMFQAMGPFPHQNSLTMYTSILGALALSRLLNHKDANPSLWFLLFGMCAFCILSTLSRAGLALFSFNCMIVFLVSMLLKDENQKSLKKRKYIILIVAPLIGAAALYKASDSIMERFTTAPKESADTRIVLAQAAMKMADENIFGVGLNNFGHKINDPYPYGADIPLEISRDPTKRGLVETAYLMIAAEAGWVTLGVFFSMLLYFYFRNIRNIFKLKNHSARYIAVAFLGALTQIYIQTTLEWVIKQTNNFYQLMLVFALIATISRIVETRKESAQSSEPVRRSDNPSFAHRQEELIKPINSKTAYIYREVPCVSNI
jgi:O-antigen ligase